MSKVQGAYRTPGFLLFCELPFSLLARRSSVQTYRSRFTIRRLMISVAVIACVVSLCRTINIYCSIMILWVPIGLLGEHLLTGTPKIRKRATTRQLITNYIILIICAVFASLAGWVGSNAGTPSSVSPLPLFSVLPGMYLSTYQFAWPVLQSETLGFLLLSAVPFMTYLILNFDLGLSAGSEPVPIRFPILMAIATLASGYWLVSGRMEGIRHQGIDYTNCVTIINILMIIILWTFWCVIRHGATKLTVFLLTALFHGWLFWYAFPWLGQLP